jgi:hypothetical protein
MSKLLCCDRGAIYWYFIKANKKDKKFKAVVEDCDGEVEALYALHRDMNTVAISGFPGRGDNH